MSDVRETLDSLYGTLSLANGIDLDENVARNYRRDVPKLLSAVENVLALCDEHERIETDEALQGELVGGIRAAIQEALGGVNHD